MVEQDNNSSAHVLDGILIDRVCNNGDVLHKTDSDDLGGVRLILVAELEVEHAEYVGEFDLELYLSFCFALFNISLPHSFHVFLPDKLQIEHRRSLRLIRTMIAYLFESIKRLILSRLRTMLVFNT